MVFDDFRPNPSPSTAQAHQFPWLQACFFYGRLFFFQPVEKKLVGGSGRPGWAGSWEGSTTIRGNPFMGKPGKGGLLWASSSMGVFFFQPVEKTRAGARIVSPQPKAQFAGSDATNVMGSQASHEVFFYGQ